MMSSMLRSYRLQLMGITEWQERSRPEISPATAYFFYKLLNPQQQLIGVLCAESNARSDTERQSEENLLINIIRALGLNRDGGYMPSTQINLSFPNAKFYLLMGNTPVSDPANSTTIQTYSPTELLQKPLLKKLTWEAIKKWKQ